LFTPFIELLRRNATVYFFKNCKECDFVTEDRGKVTTAIQVCYELSQKNRDRELEGLTSSMLILGINNGIILTYHQEETIVHNGFSLRVLPVWRWLLEYQQLEGNNP
jgi:predicted AAA+ superfamily ATPase